jgi:hypothetical protein
VAPECIECMHVVVVGGGKQEGKGAGGACSRLEGNGGRGNLSASCAHSWERTGDNSGRQSMSRQQRW